MIEIKTKGELDEILKEKENVCLKASAQWCGPCKVMDKIIEKIEPYDGVDFVKVDVDDADEDFVNSLNVRNIPLFVFYKNGVESGRSTGGMTEVDFRAKLDGLKH